APTPAPDLARAVRLRVEAIGAPPTAARRWLGPLAGSTARPVRRGLVLALAALIVLAGIVAAIGFGLPGLRIVFTGPGPTPSPTQRPTSAPIESLGLGDPVTLAVVDNAAGYPVLLPTLPELGEPLGVYVRGTPPNAQVSAAYGATSALPAS